VIFRRSAKRIVAGAMLSPRVCNDSEPWTTTAKACGACKDGMLSRWCRTAFCLRQDPRKHGTQRMAPNAVNCFESIMQKRWKNAVLNAINKYRAHSIVLHALSQAAYLHLVLDPFQSP
jgi:hypothetical protein